MRAIPYARLEAVFLDAGNTLVSLDLERIRELLAELGLAAELAALARAEAAARPVISRAVEAGDSTEGSEGFLLYLATTLRKLDPARPPDEVETTARRLAGALRAAEVGGRLWERVLPGVPEALAGLRKLGLRLVVVSNSDGTVEEQLGRAGLAPYLHAVIDSQRVGVEKPDPGIFEHALAAAGCAPERALHVGDLYAADVVGARAAGIHAALLDPYGDWGGADCERFRDLGELCERLRLERG
jgi:putative hydrolase of the HAD superfamily